MLYSPRTTNTVGLTDNVFLIFIQLDPFGFKTSASMAYSFKKRKKNKMKRHGDVQSSFLNSDWSSLSFVLRAKKSLIDSKGLFFIADNF